MLRLVNTVNNKSGEVCRRVIHVENGLDGKQLSPLYTPRNDTLISLFRITDDEQRKLRTLISRGMAAERATGSAMKPAGGPLGLSCGQPVWTRG